MPRAKPPTAPKGAADGSTSGMELLESWAPRKPRLGDAYESREHRHDYRSVAYGEEAEGRAKPVQPPCEMMGAK